jgi:hypothetical protein
LPERLVNDQIWLALNPRNWFLKLESRAPKIASQTGSRVRTSGAPDITLPALNSLEQPSKVPYDQAYEKTQLPARNAPQFGVRSGMRHFWPVRFLQSNRASALLNQNVPLRFRPSPQKTEFLYLGR